MKLLTLLLILNTTVVIGQDLNTRRLQFGLLDITTSGLIAGIGSIIHKSPDQSKFQAFTKGFIKGSIGGAINYSSYYNSFRVTEGNWGYSYLNKGLNALGSSIIENSASNKPMFSNIAIDYGPIRIDISKNTKVRLQPFATVGFITGAFISNFNLNIKNSLKYATPYFTINNPISINGVTLVNTIVLPKVQRTGIQVIDGKIVELSNPIENTISHELIHTYQYRAYSGITNIYLKNNNKYIYWDMPNLLGSYGINSILGNYVIGNYFSNYYENEAETLSTRYIPY